MNTHTHTRTPARMVLASLLASLSLAALTGCQTAHIKTTSDGWEATINSHWFKRDVDKLSVTKTGQDSYSIALNGYRSDASEQLPQFTRDVLAGLVAIGQLVPAASKTAAPQPQSAQLQPAPQAQSAQLQPAPQAQSAQLQPAQQCADGTGTDGTCADGACTDGACTVANP